MNRVVWTVGVVFCLMAIGGIGFVTGIGTLNPVLAGGGGVVGLNGLDNAQAGMRQALSGRPVQTATSKAVESVTGSNLAGEGANLAIGLVGPGAVAKMATGSGLFASLKSVGSGAWNGLKNTGSSIKNWWKGTPKVTPNGCFLPGTLVSRFTSDNIEQKEFVPIEQIKEHDRVWSCDSLSGRWQPKEVLEALIHLYTGDIITVQYEGGQIEVTGGHPIWVKTGYNLENRPRCEHIYADEHEMQPHGRWVNARDLKTGDELISHSHSLLHVLGISVRSELTTVHNLTVTDYHTYAVGNAEALVHNKSALNAIQTGGNTVNKKTAETIIEFNNLNPRKYHSKDIGDALEKLKKDLDIKNDHHGRIFPNGDYMDGSGVIRGNILDYLH